MTRSIASRLREGNLFCQEAADHIEKLEDELHHCFHRINELQAALREISSVSKVMAKREDMAQALTTLLSSHRKIALAALEGKND
tara:strand:+ start:10796 stop:11050 length:255 start_codon:yes stop_codon:yes gene_type:complete